MFSPQGQLKTCCNATVSVHGVLFWKWQKKDIFWQLISNMTSGCPSWQSGPISGGIRYRPTKYSKATVQVDHRHHHHYQTNLTLDLSDVKKTRHKWNNWWKYKVLLKSEPFPLLLFWKFLSRFSIFCYKKANALQCFWQMIYQIQTLTPRLRISRPHHILSINIF